MAASIGADRGYIPCSTGIPLERATADVEDVTCQRCQRWLKIEGNAPVKVDA